MSRRSSRGVTSGIGSPGKLEGKNGDLTIRKTKQGKILYVKEHNAWHPINTGIDVSQLKKDVDRLVRATSVFGITTENINGSPIPLKPKFKEVKIGVSTADRVILKQDSGVLKVRNAADNADAVIEAKRIKLASVSGTTGASVGQIQYNSTQTAFVAHALGMAIGPSTVGSSGDIGSLLVMSHTADSVVRFLDVAASKWTLGYDQSDSGKLKIHTGATLVDSSLFTLDTKGSIVMNVDTSGDSAEDKVGLHVDFDREVATSGTNAHNDIGINLDVNSASLGTSSVIGMDVDVVGGTDGTHTATGIDLNVSGSDAHKGINLNVTDGGKDIMIQSSANTADYCVISTTTNGATTIQTTDGDAESASLSLIADGNVILGAKTGTFRMYDVDDATKYTDLAVNSSNGAFKIDSGDEITLDSHTGVINFRDAGDTNDAFKITVVGGTGATTLETVSEAADGHMKIVADGRVEFDGCGVGFDLVAPSYDATVTDVDFRTGNKQHVVFGSGNITNLQLTFPAASGNFQVLLKQDGTGSRTITNYRVYNAAESLVGAAKFPGGSNPTLTTDANHVDIISFYWDADNEIAYGVATLDFQF